MARARVTVNSAGARELLQSAGVRAELRRRMARVADAARATAPVDSREYVDSIEQESATTDRAVERVVARAAHARLVEARTGNLARALNAAGGE